MSKENVEVIREGIDTWNCGDEPWESCQVEAEELVDAGDYVVAALLVRTVAKGTNDPVEMRLGYAYRFREREIETQVYGSFDEARAAAGLSE
jgi:ketosteroid isomerase-like protein